MSKSYQALILDMDGTLLDSRSMVHKSITQLAEEYGIALTPEQYRTAFGCAAEEFMTSLGIQDPAAASDRWREIMAGMVGDIALYGGVKEVLAAPIRRGVVTSQTREELAVNFANHRLDGLFECTVTVDATPFQKPHPRPLLYCLEQMGLSPRDALFVGDSHYDYKCALSAGVDFGLATWGAQDPLETFPEAAYHFVHPAEMIEKIAPCSAALCDPQK